ncbi:unnamed protein product [Discosporangium mesarthrocarpum]
MLQQMFIQDVFKSVEKLCLTEGIAYEQFQYRDNSNILETLDGPRGVLSMLDEECLLPHGNDSGFVSLLELHTPVQLRKQLTANSRLKQFTVHHYNHAVSYDAVGFVERNRDKLHTSVAKLLGASTNNMVKMVYAYASGSSAGPSAGSENAKPAESDFKARLAMFKQKEIGGASGARAGPKGKRVTSVMEGGQEVLKRESMGLRFKGELKQLVERIHKTEVQYILCIRPNMENNPVLFEDDYVMQQLLCASILEAAQVYKTVGVDLFHLDFIKRFCKLGPRELNTEAVLYGGSDQDGQPGYHADVCADLAAAILPPNKGMQVYEMGGTKIFIRGADHEHLEGIMGFHERVCARKIVVALRRQREVTKRRNAEEGRKKKALAKVTREAAKAKEKAAAEAAPQPVSKKKSRWGSGDHSGSGRFKIGGGGSKGPRDPPIDLPPLVVEDTDQNGEELPLKVKVDMEEGELTAAPVSPTRGRVRHVEEDEEDGEEDEENAEMNERSKGRSPSHAMVGANLTTPQMEPFTMVTMRAFLNETVQSHMGVIECMIRRKKGVMTTIYQAFYEPTMRLLMTAKKDKGRFIISMNPAFLKRGEPSTLGKVKAVAQRRQYIVYDNGFKANKTVPEKYTIKPERKEIAAVSIDLTRHDDFQGPRKLEVLVSDSDDEVVDHASLLNSFGNENTNIITPVPRMHSIKPEWDEDAGYFVLEFYKDRIKKQSVKNFMLHNSRGQFIMQFGRSKEDNVFALDFTGPFSPLAAFGVALANCDCNV